MRVSATAPRAVAFALEHVVNSTQCHWAVADGLPQRIRGAVVHLRDEVLSFHGVGYQTAASCRALVGFTNSA